MKLSWEKTIGFETHVIYITYNNIIISFHHNNPHIKKDILICTHEEFLNEKYHNIINDVFGNTISNEVLNSINKLQTIDDYNILLGNMEEKKQYIQNISYSNKLSSIVSLKNTTNGFKHFGSVGPYGTSLNSKHFYFFAGGQLGYIKNLKTKNIHPFTIPGYCTSVVEFRDYFFCISSSQFWVISSNGQIDFTTSSLFISNKEPLFGKELKAHNVLKSGKHIILNIVWTSEEFPASYLLYDLKKQQFTKRQDMQ